MAGIWWYVAVAAFCLDIKPFDLVFLMVFSTLFLVFRNKWAYLFNNDPEVVSLVASIIPLLANFQIFDGTSAIVSGVLRARGMQGVGALLNLRYVDPH